MIHLIVGNIEKEEAFEFEVNSNSMENGFEKPTEKELIGGMTIVE